MAQRLLLPHFRALFDQETLFHRTIMAVHRTSYLAQPGLRINGDSKMSIVVRSAIEDLVMCKRLSPHLPTRELLFSLAAMIVLMVCSHRSHR
jgi:hypothetical protein